MNFVQITHNFLYDKGLTFYGTIQRRLQRLGTQNVKRMIYMLDIILSQRSIQVVTFSAQERKQAGNTVLMISSIIRKE